MGQQKAIGYLRVSTAEQANGFGLEVQEQAIRTYARDRDIRLVSVLEDAGQSGSNGLDDRPALAKGLADLESGPATALIVYRLDRLARA